MYFQIISKSQKSWKGYIVRIVFQAWHNCRRKRGTQFKIELPVLKKKIIIDQRRNVVEDCIIFLAWAACVFFDFYLKQKHRYSVWSFTENVNFISFYGRILSRYSEVNKFKTSKDLTFQKQQKHTKKVCLKGIKGNFKYEKAACFTGYS